MAVAGLGGWNLFRLAADGIGFAVLRRCRWAYGWGRLRPLGGLRAVWLLYAAAAVRTVGLGNIAVIHSGHLPVWALPKNAVAMLAILAARMARSSLLIRWRLK